jgi:hypothetical protein
LKFDAVIKDIVRLVGLRLSSIKPGANICITSVDLENERVFLTDASNNKKSRPFEELRRVWECLCTDDVAHVDSVLSGSGSSRNQPETILANLPYVEWLMISNKKHLRYVGTHSHPFGTLKQMDSVAVHQLKEKLRNASAALPTSILIVNSVKSYATWIEAITGVSPRVISNGIYRVEQPGTEVWITSVADLGGTLKVGNYPVLKILNVPSIAQEITIAGRKFYLTLRDEQVYLLYTR